MTEVRGAHLETRIIQPLQDRCMLFPKGESACMVSEMSTVSGGQRGEGTYDPKMDRKPVGCGELMHWH